MLSRALKPKRCRTCRETFDPERMGQKCCSVPCALALARSDRSKAERKKLLQDKAKARSRGWYVAKAQSAFNAYIRTRDESLPCISCGRQHQGQWHAGHYLSVGARPNLRFDERNVWKQCQPCNTHLSGNLVNYRIGLIARIGVDQVESLESDHAPKHYAISDLEAIAAEYTSKRKELERSK